MSKYEGFLNSKRLTAGAAGFEFGPLHPAMRADQRDITKWLGHKGKAAAFTDCGTGKTLIYQEWSDQVSKNCGTVLTFAPLAVAEQSVMEFAKWGRTIHLCESQSDIVPGAVNITNYQKLHKFSPEGLSGIVLDESSCLKALDSVTRKSLTEFARNIPYRLACTATPSPNDYTELGNHAEFLGIISMPEMLATFFVHDGGETSKWRLKGHAETEFWKWIASWAVVMRKPSDLGYSDEGFDLPALIINEHIIDAGPAEGMLFAREARTLQERRAARRSSLQPRVRECADLVNGSDDSFIVWCDLNDESDMLRRLIPGSIEVCGADSNEWKRDAIGWFTRNECLCRNHRAKLAACQTLHTSANTTSKTKKQGSPQRPSTSNETKKKQNNTIENTSRKTKTSTKSTGNLTERLSTQESERPTPPTRGCGLDTENLPRNGNSIIPKNGLSIVSKNMESLHQTEPLSCNPNMENAQSANVMNPVESSILTIATQLEPLGDCSANNATLESENSKTIPMPSNALPCICGCKERKILISKPRIFGFGVNAQCSHRMAFVGLSDSYEAFYQAVRRQWRYGQEHDVTVELFIASTETAVLANLKRKQAEADKMSGEMIDHMKEFNQREIAGQSVRETLDYKTNVKHGKRWTAHLGDCVELIRDMPDKHFHYCIFSPPFGQLFVYSNSDRDMGNSRNWDEFWTHYDFLVQELYRVMKPGRNLSFHCMTMPTSKTHHGYIGAHDFRGDLIRAHQKHGFIFHSEVTIWKDPVTAMQRTKALGLLHKTIKSNRAMSRQGFADYLVTMRKPGESEQKLDGLLDAYEGDELDEDFTKWCRMKYEAQARETDRPMNFETFKSIQIWQRYASPVWMDINAGDTLQRESAREEKDERHIAPLQLGVIRRGIQLWSQKGDRVLSPFGGIGSEGFVAVQLGRDAVICELKESYFKQACLNLHRAESEERQASLFDVPAEEEICAGAE